MKVALRVNGQPFQGDVSPRLSLADLLRDRIGLTGTHLGCEHGICGACTVQVDGEPVRACLMFAVQADGTEVLTVEGLADGEALHPLQDAFREHHALQCGFCTPGFLMSIEPLLPDVPGVDDTELRGLLSGNLCRCTGYQQIVAATRATAAAGVHTLQVTASVPASHQTLARLADPRPLAEALRARGDGWEVWAQALDRDERTATAHLQADARRPGHPGRVRAGIELSHEDGRLSARVSARVFAVEVEEAALATELEALLVELVGEAPADADSTAPTPAPTSPPAAAEDPPQPRAHRGRRLLALGALAASGAGAAALVHRSRR